MTSTTMLPIGVVLPVAGWGDRVSDRDAGSLSARTAPPEHRPPSAHTGPRPYAAWRLPAALALLDAARSTGRSGLRVARGQHPGGTIARGSTASSLARAHEARVGCRSVIAPSMGCW